MEKPKENIFMIMFLIGMVILIGVPIATLIMDPDSFVINTLIAVVVVSSIAVLHVIYDNKIFSPKLDVYNANMQMNSIIKELEHYSNNSQMMDSCVRIDLNNNYVDRWNNKYNVNQLTPETISKIEKYKDVLKSAGIELKGIC